MKKVLISCISFIFLFFNYSYSGNSSFDNEYTTSNQLLNPDTIPLALSMCPNTMICEGDTVQIYGEASGGTGTYTYMWTPISFLSNPNISNPFAYPDSSTIYTLVVNDGVSIISDSVHVLVFHCPHPEILCTPNDTVGIEDAIVLTLDEGYLAVLWQDGSTDSSYIATNTSGPNGGEQVYWVSVVGASGCTGSDTISVWFLPQVDINETKAEITFEVYLNTTKENIHFYCPDYVGEFIIEIVNINGQTSHREEIYGDSANIDIADLSSGFYLVRVQSMDGEIISTKKIIK